MLLFRLIYSFKYPYHQNFKQYKQAKFYNIHKVFKSINPSMIKKSKLSVSVHDAQFAKDYQYQIAVSYDGNQKSTDVSALANNPIFTNNTLIFDLLSNHTLTGQVIFIANMVSDSGNGKISKKILGQCSLDLTPFGLQPTETYNLPIRQQLKFFRSKDGNQITVGKFISSLKIVQEEDIPIYLQELQTKKLEKNEYFVDLPDFDSEMDFAWRVRLQIRQGLNIPDNDGIKPQVFVQTGWTEFRDMLPQNSRTYSSSILNTNNPEWNQTFLIMSPGHITSQKGFIMIAVKDNHNLDDIFRIYVPVQSMVGFTPYNIKAIRDEKQVVKTELYFSIMLEMPYNQKDKLHDVLVNDVTFDPIIAPFKTFNIVLVSDSQNEPRLNFYPFNVKSDSIERIFEFDETQEFSYMMSQNMRIPPIKSSKNKAATVLTVSQNLLRKPISLYVVGKMDKGKYKVAGLVQNIQKDLINLLIEKVKKKLFLLVRPHPTVKMGKCQIQLSDNQESEPSLQQSRVSQQKSSARRGQQTATQKLMKDLNVSSNEGLFKHVSQNNEIIVRMLRELDDKSESLRQAAGEISSLRNKVKLLQNENSILKRNALKEEDELINLVQRQVENMSNRDLKDKIAKISHLYKSQKLRSQELDRALKHLQPQVSNSMQLQSIISNQKNQLQVFEQKILKYKKEFQRIQVYKDTIKKQQKVIMKLESVMKDGMEEVRQARKYKLQLEQMKKRGGNTNSSMYHSTSNRNDRQEIERLQRIIAELQMQQSAKMKGSSYSSKNGEDKDQSIYEMEFKLHQAETRIQSLEEELEEKSRTYGRELAMFKMKLAEKEAVLNGYSPY